MRRGGTGHGVELTAAAFNDADRAGVVVVAGDEDPVDAEGADDGQALAQDLRRVAATPVGGQDAVADVPALAFEEVVQLMADLGPADDGPADIRHQEGGGNLARGQVHAATTLIGLLQRALHVYARLEPEAEGEALRGHDLRARLGRPPRRRREAAEAGAPRGSLVTGTGVVGQMSATPAIGIGWVDPSGGHGP